MAIKKDHTIDGVEHKDLYMNFESMIHEGKIPATDSRKVHAILVAWKTLDGIPTDERVCYFEVNFAYDLASQDNLWKQAYSAAKLLPELVGAVDC